MQNEVPVIFSHGLPFQRSIGGRLIDDTTYVNVRLFAETLGGTATESGGATYVVAAGLEMEVRSGDHYLVANGNYIYVPTGVRTIGDNVYAPVRLLARAFGAAVEWSDALRTAYIAPLGPNSGPIAPTSYDSDDLYWMSRIISAEARGEPFEGKIAVGNVVMNRKNDPWHPNTVKDVIFDNRSGVQFTPAYSGAIYNTPSRDCIAAAALALDGVNVVGEAIYFAQSLNCWAGHNRVNNATIGGHYFFL
jgi:N-acetylmuramoyl-L-alanine amidase